MKNCTYPQNAVTVGAWKLMDSIRDLVPVADMPVEEDAEASAPAEKKRFLDKMNLKNVKMDKGIVAVAVATVAGAVAGITAGVITAMKNKKK
jgi:hypothetical protein